MNIEEIPDDIYECIVDDINFEFENYHILNMQVKTILENNIHKVITEVIYIKNKKPYRKIFINFLENK